jgi:hypothetical protein
MILDAQVAAARGRLLEAISADVELKRVGGRLVGLCPEHQEKTPSFYIFEGHAHCFGCGFHCDAISYVMRRRNLDFPSAVRWLLDLPPDQKRARQQVVTTRRGATESGTDTQALVDKTLAECGPITETTGAWVYMWLRGLPPRQPALYAHQSLYCAETRQNMQALVAPLRRSDGRITAIQRIYLMPVVEFDGSATAPKDNRAPLRVRKKNLGSAGDGAVQMAPAGPILGIAEGLESALAASKLYRVSAWATCGASRLHAVGLPPETREVLIFADRGEAGEAAAERAYDTYRRQGRRCSIILPEEPFGDFNDMLLRRSA